MYAKRTDDKRPFVTQIHFRTKYSHLEQIISFFSFQVLHSCACVFFSIRRRHWNPSSAQAPQRRVCFTLRSPVEFKHITFPNIISNATIYFIFHGFPILIHFTPRAQPLVLSHDHHVSHSRFTHKTIATDRKRLKCLNFRHLQRCVLQWRTPPSL